MATWAGGFASWMILAGRLDPVCGLWDAGPWPGPYVGNCIPECQSTWDLQSHFAQIWEFIHAKSHTLALLAILWQSFCVCMLFQLHLHHELWQKLTPPGDRVGHHFTSSENSKLADIEHPICFQPYVQNPCDWFQTQRLRSGDGSWLILCGTTCRKGNP